jgi:hypothetical protein
MRNWVRENKILVILNGAVLIFLSIAWVVYSVYGHEFIKAMYEGRAIGFLNAIIEGQDRNPLEQYLRHTDRVMGIGFVIVVAVSLVVSASARFISRDYIRPLALAGIFVGLAMASKFSALYLIPIFAVVAVTHVYSRVYGGDRWPRRSKMGTVATLFCSLMVMSVIAVLILVVTYGVINVDALLNGLWLTFSRIHKGRGVYLMGEYLDRGSLLYFPLAFVIKTPTALLGLIAMVLIWYRKINPEPKQAFKRDLVLLVPAGVILGMAMGARINIGIRYILPIYPLLFVFVGQVTNMSWGPIRKYGVIGGLVGWFVISSLFISPHYLAYFNELVGGPDRGHQYLLDSNIDWGQDLKLLSMYVKEHNIDKIHLAYFGWDSCANRGIKCEQLGCSPRAGVLAVSVNNLVGLYPAMAKCLAWLREFKPIKKIGYSIFVYNLEENDMARLGKK